MSSGNDNDELNEILATDISGEFEDSISYAQEAVEELIEDLKNNPKVFSHCQFSQLMDNQFTPCGPTTEVLSPSVYKISKAHGIGLIFSRIPIKVENLISFPDSNSEKVISEIADFWDREEIFKEFEFPHKRGILLWGPPGSGKSSTIQLIIKDVIDRQGIVLLFDGPNIFIEGYNVFRHIQPETPVVVIMEDLDEIIHRWGEQEVLQILDGVHRVHKTCFLACHSPDTRILTRDFRWIPAKDIVSGDEIWSLDENRSEKTSLTGRETSRRFRKGKVISSFKAKKECVRIHLDTGESFVCTVDHPWLSSGAKKRGGRNLEWTLSCDLLENPNLCRPFIPWETDGSWESVWLAGMLDGEGLVRKGRGDTICGIGLAQSLGKTASKMEKIANKYCEFTSKILKGKNGNKDQLRMRSNGGLASALSLVGTVRAERLIEKIDLSGTIVQNKYPARVIKIEPIGEQEIQSIETDVHTYFAEGFAVHNTTNYPQRLKARVINRPSRFDKRFKIDFPNPECRRVYLESIKKTQDIDLDKWVKDTDQFSFAHLKELFIATKILGNDYDEALSTLKSMRQRVSTDESEEFEKGKLGFSK